MTMPTGAALSKIIIVGKQPDARKLARPYTQELFAADEISDLNALIESTDPQLILIDYAVPRREVAAALESIREKGHDLPVVVLGDENDLSAAEHLKKLGAFDYLLGRPDYSRLEEVIAALTNTHATKENENSTSGDARDYVSIVGRSEATRQTTEMINLVAKSSCNPVLIVGETGTGKELAARAVHILRHGSDARFVGLNCAALTANLLESELFGHVKGSFTGADRDKVGLLQLASGGSVLLDEISEMPMELQAKLLRVLQEKTFRKVGGVEDIKCNATIIASSNRNLYHEVQDNRFRRDLYYRLAVCPVTIAPLRSAKRRDDIPVLAEYFLRNSDICPEKKGQINSLTKLAVEALMKHDWPGNVRELRNVIDRAILLENTDKIGLSSLVINPDMHHDSAGPMAGAGSKDFSLERAERELIARALEETDWQKTRAAALLGITRATLYAKVKQYRIQEPGSSEKPQAAACPGR